ncbi:unnamed protein product [Thlaspi arvense]|uniref:Uncharacterized protein n=1 Tax=Thlaspi arvense TaxID=13288 RepID=A0AAU9T8G8_THLAR|nr:unnamed protein product [Thlaspi arvense]
MFLLGGRLTSIKFVRVESLSSDVHDTLLRSWEASYLFGVYGVRLDHLWQAVVYPVSLTSLMYAGSLVLKSISLLKSWKEHRNDGEGHSSNCMDNVLQILISKMLSFASDVLSWRYFIVMKLSLFCLVYDAQFFCVVYFMCHLRPSYG